MQKRPKFLKSYEFTCPECGKVQHAAPSMFMTIWGFNMGGGSCLYCKTYLHLEITPDLFGKKMTATTHEIWAEDFKNKKQESQ